MPRPYGFIYKHAKIISCLGRSREGLGGGEDGHERKGEGQMAWFCAMHQWKLMKIKSFFKSEQFMFILKSDIKGDTISNYDKLLPFQL